MKLTRQRLSHAALEMNSVLKDVTGLPDVSRKIVIYYTLATHALRSVDIFPLLVLLGPMGTGKSQAQNAIAAFAYQPNTFSLRGRTSPVIRDELAESHEGTAIIEEADQAWNDDTLFERMLSDRYHRASAQAALKESHGDSWTTRNIACFGATVLHRRLPFSDPALNGRSVTVRFRPDTNRSYERFDLSEVESRRKLVRDLTFELPDVAPPANVAGRVFDSYMPLIALANLCCDDQFLKEIGEEMLLRTADLKEAQSVEPDVLVLRALVGNLPLGNGKMDFHNVKFSALAKSIWRHHRISMKPQQVGSICRHLGFETKISHGVSVVVPTPARLVEVCLECGYEDEAITTLREEILGSDDR